MSGAKDVFKAAVNPFWALSAKAADKGVEAITPDMPSLPEITPEKPNQTMPEPDMDVLAKTRRRRISEMRQRSGRASTIMSDTSTNKLGG